MNTRIEAELELLRLHYRKVEYVAAGPIHWFSVHDLRTPDGWMPDVIPAAFLVTEGHPGVQPYGFFVPEALSLNNKPPSETKPPHQPPFVGRWRFLSWQPEGWQPTADVRTGSNLWAWVRSFMHRLREGV